MSARRYPGVYHKRRPRLNAALCVYHHAASLAGGARIPTERDCAPARVETQLSLKYARRMFYAPPAGWRNWGAYLVFIWCLFGVYFCKITALFAKQQKTRMQKTFIFQGFMSVRKTSQNHSLRTHNPEVVRFKSHPRNQRKP